MGRLFIVGTGIAIALFKGLDPLLVIAIAVCAYLYIRQRAVRQAVSSLEYWKAKEYEARLALQENKEDEKDRRVRVREARADRRRRVVRESKEMRLFDKIFKESDHALMKKLPIEARRDIAKMYNLKPETLEAWLVLTDEQINRKKIGLEDEVD